MTKPSYNKAPRDLLRRDALIAEWRREGRTYARIAADLPAEGFAPLSRSRLGRIARAARDAEAADCSAEEFRKAGLKRLDELEAVLHKKALSGENAAVDRLLAIMDRRAKLLGVAAAPSQLGGAEASAKEALQQKLDAMAARLAGPEADERR